MRKLINRITSQSTKDLMNLLLWFELVFLLIAAVWGYLLQRYSDNNIFLFLFGASLLLFMVTLFLIGTLFFVRKEDPYTISNNWFGIRFFSYGIWPTIIGLTIMLISGVVLIVLFILPLIRIIFNYL